MPNAHDELDDGLDYAVEYLSDEGRVHLDPELDQVDLEQDLEQPNDKEHKDTNTNTKTTSTVTSVTSDTGTKRKAEKGDKFKEKKRLKMQMDLDQKQQISAEASPEVIADYINRLVAQKNKKMSALELGELYLSKNDIRSSHEFGEERTLENVAEFINWRFSNMLQSTKGKDKKGKGKKGKDGGRDGARDGGTATTFGGDGDGRKFICFISMSAIRACDIHRSTKPLPGSSLKLINKNKIDVDLKLVRSSTSRVLCCTPGRVMKVLEHEDSGLDKKEIKIVILDNSYLDQKGQNIWDIPETIRVVKELAVNGAKIYLY